MANLDFIQLREQAGFSATEAAAYLGLSIDRVADFDNGLEVPVNVRQALLTESRLAVQRIEPSIIVDRVESCEKATLGRYQDASLVKRHGQTYTPTELANFVAEKICTRFDFTDLAVVNLLDPAIGDGELSLALIRSVRKRFGGKIALHAFDIDSTAIVEAETRILKEFDGLELIIHERDFLGFVAESSQSNDLLSHYTNRKLPTFDLIIANPPYVRTQVMGSLEAQRLAAEFGLSGRVDLYHAFLLAMAKVLASKGAAGFIVSNRFMTTKGGGALRVVRRQII